ncbi:hypothetical protein D9613_011321 [Agrocybe pediades]|uniref:SH3 domain-containing protein n=1 Tax=Agrocybe pediades TaxID=84607 RepID=A0A8H4VPU3_9AGAR|nr:hypothetical protein D9613_011321 [Agrocybe pediades]
MSGDPRRAHLQRQDTFDLRDQIRADNDPNSSQHLQAHADAAAMHHQNQYMTSDEERSILDDDMEMERDDSELEDDQVQDEDEIYDDEGSSTLSIPNESIDFDMVYALHSFAATVEGQANVVKGDSLYLMDDSNSYWWLVRVLKTQEVGYIPAENIETPFERLARLNKHRNIDLALPTQVEQEDAVLTHERLLRNVQFQTGSTDPLPSRGPPGSSANRSDSGSRANNRRSVHFNYVRSQHRYPPALRDGEEEDPEDEWNTDGFEDEDIDLANDLEFTDGEDDGYGMEGNDSMQWDDLTAEEAQLRQHAANSQATGVPIPDALQPGSMRQYQEQQRLRAQQQEQLQQSEEQFRLQQQQQLQYQQQQEQQQALAQQQASQQAAQAQQEQLAQQQQLRKVSSREQLAQDETAQAQGPRRIDPLEATETRKMTATPTIAREADDRPAGQPYLPSIIVEDEQRKRQRDDDTSTTSSEDSAKKKAKGKEKMAAPVSSAMYNKQPAGKLRKEPSKEKDRGTDTEDDGKDKKKKGVFSGLFGRSKKDKGRDKTPSLGSIESSEYLGRGSEESGRSSGHRPSLAPLTSDGSTSPVTSAAQQQQQALAANLRNTVSDMRANQNQTTPSTPERNTNNAPQVSEHANQLRQRDQQHMTLYKEYLNRSPSSPPEAQPSYGLQSASAVMLSSPSSGSGLGPPVARPRPGSLILTSPSSNDIQGSLSVIRVFAGKHLQTEATFKTVLLNPSTTASDLVRQAIQRFRLPAGEDENDYYLTVKQVEGGASTVLQPVEHPLVVFETLVVESTELPKVKRSSVGSISSVSSNLSMHPAIKKLPMNDFTDDSAVKFYLNRKSEGVIDESSNGHDGDDTLIADSTASESDYGHNLTSPTRGQFLSGANERFSSPSARFAVQLVIYAEDLPDDMQFHPQTEAIVLKSSLTDPNAPILVSPNLRRKIFMFPKNVTVAEVTETSLERFGIQDGVIDGGDEVEDKTTKRRSGVRVRYGLMVSIDGHEKELAPSSRLIEAFPKPPQFKAPERQMSGNKRRSLDSSHLLGSLDDIRPEDPVFVLRRATSYRNSTSRKRFSAPLDEIALQHLHRESTSSYNSEAQAQSPVVEENQNRLKQPSRQEIIAAQRAATRATQRAIVSASTNSVRGMDVLLPGNAMLRSSRYEASDRMRYSYVEPDGETYDVSDIIEEEWKEMNNNNKNDLLEGVFIRNKDGIGEKLDRVLNKIRKGKGKERDYSSLSSADSDIRPVSTVSASEYSVDDTERSGSVTPGSAPLNRQMIPDADEDTVHVRSTPVSNPNPAGYDERNNTSRPGTTTPTAGLRTSPQPVMPLASRRNPSIASVMSDQSGRATPNGGQQQQSNLSRLAEEEERSLSSRDIHTPSRNQQQSQQQQRRLVIPKDDFGHASMMAIIEYKALAAAPKKETPSVQSDPVEELLFGKKLDLETLHPQIRDIYAAGFKQLEEMDKVLDGYIGRSVVGAF